MGSHEIESCRGFACDNENSVSFCSRQSCHFWVHTKGDGCGRGIDQHHVGPQAGVVHSASTESEPPEKNWIYEFAICASKQKHSNELFKMFSDPTATPLN